MVLLIGIITGLIAGTLRAYFHHQPYHLLNLRGWWLVLIAFLPQYLAFGQPARSVDLPDGWIPYILVGSQTLLLFFVWLNRQKPGMWLLGAGLALNFAAVIANGGMMPISPESVQRLAPDAPPGTWQVNERLGITKDVVLPVSATRLWFLSDRFILPMWANNVVAFSVGDVIIAVGVFFVLWTAGKPISSSMEVSK